MVGKKLSMAAALTAGITLLGGCGKLNLDIGRKEWIPREPDGISIKEDGTIVQTIVDTLDASYYSVEELQQMISSEAQSYNTKYGEASVMPGETETLEDGSVKVSITYASSEDYSRFNNVEFYYGSMINAQLAGYLFDTSFQRISGGQVKETSVTGSKVISEMDKQVLILHGPVEVQVPGELVYISTNSEPISANVVNAIGGHEEEEVIELVLPSNDIYRSGGETHTFEEEMAAGRVYVIFDDAQ